MNKVIKHSVIEIGRPQGRHEGREGQEVEHPNEGILDADLARGECQIITFSVHTTSVYSRK